MSRSSRDSIKDRLRDVGIVAPNYSKRDGKPAHRPKNTHLYKQYDNGITEPEKGPQDSDLAFFLRRMRMPMDTEMEDLEHKVDLNRKAYEREERRKKEEANREPTPPKYLYGSYKTVDQHREEKLAKRRKERQERELTEERESFLQQQASARFKFDTKSLVTPDRDDGPEEDPYYRRRNKAADEAADMRKVGELKAKKLERDTYLHKPQNSRYQFKNDKLEYVLTDDEEEIPEEKPNRRNKRVETPESEQSDDKDPEYYKFLFKHGAKYTPGYLEGKVLGRKTPTEKPQMEESDGEDFFLRPTFTGARKKAAKKVEKTPERKTEKKSVPKKSVQREILSDSEEDDFYDRPLPAKKKYDSYKDLSPDRPHQRYGGSSSEEEEYISFHDRYGGSKSTEPSVQVLERQKDRRERERRNDTFDKRAPTPTAEKIKEDLIYFKHHKPKSYQTTNRATPRNNGIY